MPSSSSPNATPRWRGTGGEGDRPGRQAELEEDRRRLLPRAGPRAARFPRSAAYYWFCHLGVITELNGWDSFNPGHLDQHLLSVLPARPGRWNAHPRIARELLECFFIKFNNHPAPPKVGVTAAESGTYTDFANINIGGLRGWFGRLNEVSHLLLDIVDEMHLLQPSTNIQLSRKSPDRFLKHACASSARAGFPSIFNADAVVQEQLRQGKTLEDARAGGCSGCVEDGRLRQGSLHPHRLLQPAQDARTGAAQRRRSLTGKQLGPRTGEPDSFESFDDLYGGVPAQLKHFLESNCAATTHRAMYATQMPAPFLRC
jgi:trans-4-hydroxy-L-proline dehydratase